jgi:hypothetical protein
MLNDQRIRNSVPMERRRHRTLTSLVSTYEHYYPKECARRRAKTSPDGERRPWVGLDRARAQCLSSVLRDTPGPA